MSTDQLIPSQSQNPSGFHQRYIVSRSDGTPTDPNAVYFVGRLDNGGKDPVHLEACRQAARMYVTVIGQLSGSEHLHQMAKELDRLIDKLASERLDFPGFLSEELRDMLMNPVAYEAAFDYNSRSETMAEAMGADASAKWHHDRAEFLKTRIAVLTALYDGC